jgi:hypothetical protein
VSFVAVSSLVETMTEEGRGLVLLERDTLLVGFVFVGPVDPDLTLLERDSVDDCIIFVSLFVGTVRTLPDRPSVDLLAAVPFALFELSLLVRVLSEAGIDLVPIVTEGGIGLVGESGASKLGRFLTTSSSSSSRAFMVAVGSAVD